MRPSERRAAMRPPWHREPVRRAARALAGLALALPGPAAVADPQTLAALAPVRATCTGQPGAAGWRPNAALDRAARAVAAGTPLERAVEGAGYAAQRTVQLALQGYPNAAAAARGMAASHCQLLRDAQLTELGVHRQGTRWWLLFGQPFAAPAADDAQQVAQAVLRRVNAARAQPRRCGGKPFQPAPPLTLDARLTQAAAVHAQDQARRRLLTHEGADGSSVAQRVSRTGYNWRSVGENVAVGQATADQVVDDWLRSPEHCANIMDAAFRQMGIAYSTTLAGFAGIYWTQTLARPR